MGKVGNDRASSITCSCPLDIDRITYDSPRDKWKLQFDDSKAINIDEIQLTNNCDSRNSEICSDDETNSEREISVTTQHNWGTIFKAGVSYTATASVELEGIGGMETSYTTSFETEKQTGGSHETGKTIKSSLKCVAKPGTKKTCRQLALKGVVEMGYTIWWTNGRSTKGKYIGEGWKLQTITNSEVIKN